MGRRSLIAAACRSVLSDFVTEGSPRTGAVQDLLTPSLTSHRTQAPIFSVRANFLVAFFGGGFAALCFAALNSRRLGRFDKDLWLLGLGLVFFVGFYLFVGYNYSNGENLSVMQAFGDEVKGPRRLGQAFALGFYGLIYLRHRSFYRASGVARMEPANPWVPGLLTLVGSLVLCLLFAVIGVLIAR